MQLTYATVVHYSEGDECFVASVPALGSCTGHGDTPAEAVESAFEAAELYVEELQHQRRRVPRASHRRDYSGRFQVRVLHGVRLWMNSSRPWLSAPSKAWLVQRQLERTGDDN